MTSNYHRTPSQFGQRKTPHKITISKGDEVTNLHIHPAVALVGVGCVFAMALSYIGATGYLMLRDDLLNASNTHQARVQHAYEDRLANLRVEIDRIASRQMLDQRSVENKIDRLLGLRASVDERWKTVDALTRLANASGVAVPSTPPNPRARPTPSEQANAVPVIVDTTTTASIASGYAPSASPNFPTAVINTQEVAPNLLDLVKIEHELKEESVAQLSKLQIINAKTEAATKDIETALKGIGVKPKRQARQDNDVGGPFIPAGNTDAFAFDNTILSFEDNLNYLKSLKKAAVRLPLSKPMRGASVSSNFGRRVDPFLGRSAFHSGIDYRAKTGTSVFSAGPGKVIKAGWHGGYGRMVEVRHANGLSTRYAHLSRISVKIGQHVSVGERVGRVGSTGRSTGPHLHYEVRLNKKALNPKRFLNAGNKIRQYL